MYNRSVKVSKSNSFFLFGARGTGKSTYLKHHFTPDEMEYIDLLDFDYYNRLISNPNELKEILAGSPKPWCVIDEIQRVPQLLDLVHSLIETKRHKFALTGSSARKLKRDGANMLGGRAFLYKLYPLTHQEMGPDFELNLALQFGTLAKITEFLNDQDRAMFLKSYVDTYLKEEILIEQIIRNLPPFKKFLEVAATNDTEIINYSNVARDVRSNPNSIVNYYSILEDTLLGFFLPPYHTSIRKRQKQAPKFYFFDTGVKRALMGLVDVPLVEKSYEYGSLFESYIVNEIQRILSYEQKSFSLSYLRVDDHSEIDLIIERPGLPTFLIEIKSTKQVNERHLASLNLYLKDFPHSHPFLVSLDPIKRKINGVTCLHWKEFFENYL